MHAPQRRSLLVVLVLCVAALGLRLRGIDALAPCVTPLDELVVIRQIELYRTGSSDLLTQGVYYPHALALAVAALPAPAPAAAAGRARRRCATASGPSANAP